MFMRAQCSLGKSQQASVSSMLSSAFLMASFSFMEVPPPWPGPFPKWCLHKIRLKRHTK